MNPLPCSLPIIPNSPKGEDLILGYDFLYHFNPIIDWKNGLITYDSSHKYSSGIISSTSNDFATAVNSVALVGELKTPSLPPSVHIPSIIPSQSLLSSSNEVFKEIKDVGEDADISSLHLFQGDMDLPPLSLHASLGEQWDEEEEPEEIETVLKVVPPAYNQYLEVFSKVKAEKLPPHRACDHHIELEGLLPPEALSQFQILKEAFTTSPNLSHFDPSLPTIVETDASDYALGAVLSQVNDSGKHPIAFDSRKLLPAELNYEIHDKELLGIVWAVKRWRAFLLSLSNSFEVLTDHSSLQYFMSSKVLTRREAYVVDKIKKDVWQHKDYKEILKQLARGESVPDYSLEPQAKLLLFKDRVVIPSNEELQFNILQRNHESPLAGHPGQEKTLKLIKSDFYWAGMNQFIKDYVSSCQQCLRNKNIHQKKFGLLKPLQIPSGPWNSLSMDFITQLPLSNNFDSILVAVDSFSKMAIFSPAYGIITALELAQIFISHVFSKHGLPVSIISDRGSLCVLSFWTQLFQQLKISRDLSTAFHSETDGQTERLSTKLQSVQQVVKEELESAIRRFKKYADRNRANPPDFQPGDKVWLANKNIKTTRPTKKLSERWLGPSEALKKIGSHEYHLKLPQQWNSVYPVFHVSLLEPVKHSTIPNQHHPPPPPVVVEEQE
ncbi:hypothetical protein O181_020638 [Austropuccinia psidii MF-1]|uniref:Integrase catalytic domain-containing protein n=1 Tax=Austropuccinia psidii MF-1 TaxID=1389203 RepID=A0A9Q3GUP8_9BASI|nr:hypothetical protein [Austropuccinia psidii MF-1]